MILTYLFYFVNFRKKSKIKFLYLFFIAKKSKVSKK